MRLLGYASIYPIQRPAHKSVRHPTVCVGICADLKFLRARSNLASARAFYNIISALQQSLSCMDILKALV